MNEPTLSSTFGEFYYSRHSEQVRNKFANANLRDSENTIQQTIESGQATGNCQNSNYTKGRYSDKIE